MSESDSPSAPTGDGPTHDVPKDDVVVQLLDAALGRPVKTWKFSGSPDITIGRLPECSVEISDAYVPRLHAVLQCREGLWTLISHGRSGIIVSNRQISEMLVDSD